MAAQFCPTCNAGIGLEKWKRRKDIVRGCFAYELMGLPGANLLIVEIGRASNSSFRCRTERFDLQSFILEYVAFFRLERPIA